MSLTLAAYLSGIKSGSLDPFATISAYADKATQDPYNAFVRMHQEYIDASREEFAKRPLAAAPLGIKDIFLTKGYETTCCSRILQGYIPSYSSTVFSRLEDAGGLMIGKTNMDEFAMGTSNETSCFGVVKNPHDMTRVAGGSSGGSAAAVAGDLCLAALATDTGGSIRLPASLCGIVGTKATYGRTSRYGVQAMASSLDHIGTLTKTVEDALILFSVMSGQDPHDATTIPFDAELLQSRYDALEQQDCAGKKIALPKEFFGEGLDPEVKELCLQAVAGLEARGAQVEWIDLPILSASVPTYYILCPAEVSTNMARFDGIRFGLQHETGEYERIHDYYAAIRDEGFGLEVKRRILTGAYVLSAGFYDAYYRKALALRAQMRREFAVLFETYDAIVCPTCAEPAWKIGEKIDDPLKSYLADLYAIPANLVGCPAISIPVGYAQKEGVNLPVGMQIMTAPRDEATMFGLAHQVELLHA